MRVARTVSPARLRRARLVPLFAFTFALILAPPARSAAQETAAERARAHLDKGRALTARREYDQALAELDEALSVATSEADRRLAGEIQVARGEAFYSKRDWPHMGEAYRAAADLFDAAGAFREEARALRGLVYDPELPWEERERIVEHAADVLRRDPDPVVEGLLLHIWGDILVNLGRYGRALEKLEQARARLEGSTEEAALARVLTSLGRARRLHGQPEEALPYYRKALEIQMRVQDLSGASQSENAMAVAYSHLLRVPEMLAHSARAVALAERSGNANQVAFTRLLVGIYRAQAGDWQGSRDMLASLEGVLVPVDEANRLTSLACAEVRLGRKQDAMTHAEAAVSRARALGNPYYTLYALESRARAHTALDHQAEALQDIREAVTILESMRSNLSQQDQARQGFADPYGRIFSLAISLLVQAGRDLEALEVAEQARARAFLDLLTTRDLAPSASEEAREAQRRQLANAAPISGLAMRETLARLGSTLVAYWVGSDDATVWVLAPDGTIHARRLSVTADHLRSLTRALGAPPAGTSAGPKRDPARDLYEQLVRPIEAWLPSRTGSRITIVPHGPLFALPFAALRDAQGRYLVERWAPHYASSMSVLDRLDARGEGLAPRGALIVADPRLDSRLVDREGLSPLPTAQEEGEAVAQRHGAGGATVLTGATATVAAVRQAAPAKRIVHFATHAVVSDTRPLESFLALAPGDGNDGRLTSAEIYGWRLSADLVVLSACRTARGRVNGDGVIGLSRAFAYAGTPSLIASVWDAPDQTSRELFPTFYAEWQRTGDRAGALRTAQLALIRRLRAGEIVVTTPAGPVTLRETPALWAPFVLLGEP